LPCDPVAFWLKTDARDEPHARAERKLAPAVRVNDARLLGLGQVRQLAPSRLNAVTLPETATI